MCVCVCVCVYVCMCVVSFCMIRTTYTRTCEQTDPTHQM